MELLISLNEEISKQGIIHLKDFIDRSSIEGIEQTEIERRPPKEGQMGFGEIFAAVKTIIEAAERPLVELIKCLFRYVENYRTEINIQTKNGEKIVLKHGRSMKPDDLQNIVVAIQKGLNNGTN